MNTFTLRLLTAVILLVFSACALLLRLLDELGRQ